MATTIKNIIVIASTSTRRYARSRMFVELLIPGIAAGERKIASAESGGTTVTKFGVSGVVNLEDISPADINVSAEPPYRDDAWLPSTFYVLGENEAGELIPIVSIPEWPPQIWISMDPDDHRYPPAFSSVNLQQVLDAM